MPDPIPYTYCPLRYHHDPLTGECLNIGVLVCAPGYLVARFTEDVARLEVAFPGFNVAHYRRVTSVAALGLSRITEICGPKAETYDAGDVGRFLWPDQGLGFRCGPTLAGVTDDLADATERLFVRMVAGAAHA